MKNGSIYAKLTVENEPSPITLSISKSSKDFLAELLGFEVVGVLDALKLNFD